MTPPIASRPYKLHVGFIIIDESNQWIRLTGNILTNISQKHQPIFAQVTSITVKVSKCCFNFPQRSRRPIEMCDGVSGSQWERSGVISCPSSALPDRLGKGFADRAGKSGPNLATRHRHRCKAEEAGCRKTSFYTPE